MIPSAIRAWVAFGSGVGIQIAGPRGAESMHVAAVRVRPSGTRVLGGFSIEDFPHQPAGVWGTDYAAFVRKIGLQQASATVLLPRQDVIVRQLPLPGVSDKDLTGAVEFQLDGLHPYQEDEVVTSWTRLPGTSTVLVTIAQKEAIERYAVAFAEAGIRINAFSCSAAAVYSALRLFGRAPAGPVLAFESTHTGGVEIYGESPARPLFSANFEVPVKRAAAMAHAELRTESASLPEGGPEGGPGGEPQTLGDLLKSTAPLPYAAALASACPRLSLSLNLLPLERRVSSSPLAWVPTTALGAVVLLLATALVALPSFEKNSYLKSLEAEIGRIQPVATRSAAIDGQVASAQRRMVLLDDFRRRPKADMDILAELTRLLPPPTWLNLMELNARQVTVGGETDQAAPLLKILDASPLFEASEFAMPPLRINPQAGPNGTVVVGSEGFRIRANREALKP